MYVYYYHEQLAKIITCVIYSIDAYQRYILPRYILSFCFGNLNSRDYHGDSLNVMFPRFPNCFLPFPLVFPHVSPSVFIFSIGVSSVSYFRFCGSKFEFKISSFKCLVISNYIIVTVTLHSHCSCILWTIVSLKSSISLV